MLTKTVIYEGTVRDGREEELFDRVRNDGRWWDAEMNRWCDGWGTRAY